VALVAVVSEPLGGNDDEDDGGTTTVILVLTFFDKSTFDIGIARFLTVHDVFDFVKGQNLRQDLGCEKVDDLADAAGLLLAPPPHIDQRADGVFGLDDGRRLARFGLDDWNGRWHGSLQGMLWKSSTRHTGRLY
jgi:hypothetical protein